MGAGMSQSLPTTNSASLTLAEKPKTGQRCTIAQRSPAAQPWPRSFPAPPKCLCKTHPHPQRRYGAAHPILRLSRKVRSRKMED